MFFPLIISLVLFPIGIFNFPLVDASECSPRLICPTVDGVALCPPTENIHPGPAHEESGL